MLENNKRPAHRKRFTARNRKTDKNNKVINENCRIDNYLELSSFHLMKASISALAKQDVGSTRILT
jgi:hypothetical protein